MAWAALRFEVCVRKPSVVPSLEWRAPEPLLRTVASTGSCPILLVVDHTCHAPLCLRSTEPKKKNTERGYSSMAADLVRRRLVWQCHRHRLVQQCHRY